MNLFILAEKTAVIRTSQTKTTTKKESKRNDRLLPFRTAMTMATVPPFAAAARRTREAAVNATKRG